MVTKHKNKRRRSKASPVRHACIDVCLSSEDSSAPLAALLANVERRYTLSPENQKWITWLIKGIQEARQELGIKLAATVSGDFKNLPPNIQWILRLGLFELLESSAIPGPVAVSEAVELARSYSGERMAKLVNAVLRKHAAKSSAGEQVSDENRDNTNHPEWMIGRWTKRYGSSETQKLVAANNAPWPLCIRTNTLKTTTSELRQLLDGEGVQWMPAQWLVDSTYLTKLPRMKRLTDLRSFVDGLFIVQDESSSLVTFVLDPLPGEQIIDVCSAPGGKTTHIAQLMRNEGKILACDSSEMRLELVVENCKRLGITCVSTCPLDAASMAPTMIGDRVLVDAPCSGLGVLGRKPDARWRKKESDIADLSELQARILDSAAKSVRLGGVLVYSTCTIEPEENEKVLGAFLDRHPAFSLDRLPAGVPDGVRVGEHMVLLPHVHTTAGGFAARLVRHS